MAIIGKFEVTIQVNGHDLKEYNDDDENQHEANTDNLWGQDRCITRFIEAQGGQSFSIRIRVDRSYKLPRGANSLDMSYFADGTYLDSTVRGDLRGYRAQDSVYVQSVTRYSEGSSWMEKDLVFKELENVSDTITTTDRKFEVYSTRGTITIILAPYLKTGSVQRDVTETVENLEVAEKATKGKAVTLGVGFGPQRRTSHFRTAQGRYIGLKTTFIFEYRNKESLKQLMIIPRTPSPEPEIPLADRDPATLTPEEMRQLIRELKATQQVKPEFGVKDEDSKKRMRVSTPVDDDELQVVSTKKARVSEPSEAIFID